MTPDADIQAVDDFMSYSERVAPGWLERCVGASPEAVREVEAAGPIPLPPEYPQFLLRMGATPQGALTFIGIMAIRSVRDFFSRGFDPRILQASDWVVFWRVQISNPTLKFAPCGRWDAPSARPMAAR